MRTPPLALHQVMIIARDVAREHRPAVEVIGVIPSEGGRDSAEIVVVAVGPLEADADILTIPVLRARPETELRTSIAEGLSRFFPAA